MCNTPDIEAAAPTPQAPPVLEQVAPKSASTESGTEKKRKGFSSYKIGGSATAPKSTTNKLGGIPKKTGV